MARASRPGYPDTTFSVISSDGILVPGPGPQDLSARSWLTASVVKQMAIGTFGDLMGLVGGSRGRPPWDPARTGAAP